MSQASVSRRIRELEADLGISLFERHRYDVAPTAEAEVLAASVQLSLRELSSTADLLRRSSAETAPLTILTSLALASVVVTPIVGELQRRHPDLKIRVLALCEPIETTNENFDIAVQYGPSESRAFTVDFIADEAVFPVCSPALAAQLPSPATLADLACQQLLDVDYEDPSWATWHDVLGPTVGSGAKHDLAIVFSSYQVCLDVAERGEGIALGWERSVQPRLDAGTLVRIPGVTRPRAGLINAYLPKHRAVNPQAIEFLTLLKCMGGFA